MTLPELLRLAQSLNERDEPYALVTVVRVAPPTSAYVGAQALVERDGRLHGWIGGGCAKDAVVASARAAIASGEPTLLRITNDGEPVERGIQQQAMACASNGTIELFIQPYSAWVSLCVVGDTPAAAEARFFAGRLGIRLVGRPADAGVVLVATQGSGDLEALEAALASKARHVLMIASRRKADTLRRLLAERGVDAASLARLEAPAGPDAGAKAPSEIALVAMTGVLAALRERDANAAASPAARPQAAAAAGNGIFVNPVCGTRVSTATPMHVEHYEGEAYYFCCNGCWQTFRANPAKYAAIRHAAGPPATP